MSVEHVRQVTAWETDDGMGPYATRERAEEAFRVFHDRERREEEATEALRRAQMGPGARVAGTVVMEVQGVFYHGYGGTFVLLREPAHAGFGRVQNVPLGEFLANWKPAPGAAP